MEKIIPDKYNFDPNTLSHDFEDFMKMPLRKWISNSLECVGMEDAFSGTMSNEIIQLFQLKMREVIPMNKEGFYNHIFHSNDNIIMALQIVLSIIGHEKDAHFATEYGELLEGILRVSGSAYAAKKEDGLWFLTKRVPDIVEKQSENALSNNEYLKKAWQACHGVPPNYNKVVQESINAMEQLLHDKYQPRDHKCQLGRIIRNINSSNHITMEYAGKNIPQGGEKEILDLISNLVRYRGDHKAGNGQDADEKNGNLRTSYSHLYFYSAPLRE